MAKKISNRPDFRSDNTTFTGRNITAPGLDTKWEPFFKYPVNSPIVDIINLAFPIYKLAYVHENGVVALCDAAASCDSTYANVNYKITAFGANRDAMFIGTTPNSTTTKAGEFAMSKDGFEWTKIDIPGLKGGITKMVTACEAASKTCVFGTNKGQIYAWGAGAKTADDFKNVYNETSESPVTALYVTYRSVGSSLLQESIAVGGFKNGKLGYVDIQALQWNEIEPIRNSAVSQFLTYSYQEAHYLITGFNHTSIITYDLNSDSIRSSEVVLRKSQGTNYTLNDIALSSSFSKNDTLVFSINSNNKLSIFFNKGRLDKCFAEGEPYCNWSLGLDQLPLNGTDNNVLKFGLIYEKSLLQSSPYIFSNLSNDKVAKIWIDKNQAMNSVIIADSGSWLQKDEPIRAWDQPPATHIIAGPTHPAGFSNLIVGLRGGEAAMENSIEVSVPTEVLSEVREIINANFTHSVTNFTGVNQILSGWCWGAAVSVIIKFYRPEINATQYGDPSRSELSVCEIQNRFNYINRAGIKGGPSTPKNWTNLTPKELGIDCCKADGEDGEEVDYFTALDNYPTAGVYGDAKKKTMVNCSETQPGTKIAGCGPVCKGGSLTTMRQALKYYNITIIANDSPGSFFRINEEVIANKPIYLSLRGKGGHAITAYGYNTSSIPNAHHFERVQIWDSSPKSKYFGNKTVDYTDLFQYQYNENITLHWKEGRYIDEVDF